jgi:P-type E1-E2 ATPase
MLVNGPNQELIYIENIILDLNGTLANYGKVSEKAIGLIKQLKKLNYNVVLISGDIRGNASTIAEELQIELLLGANSEEKAKQMQQFDYEKTAAIGNARIDIGTFQNAKISIATIQAEGIHTGVLEYIDILVNSIEDALNLFIETKALEATLRV